MLVDSESIHNFIDTQTVKDVKVIMVTTIVLVIIVANEDVLSYDSYCLRFK